MNKFFTGMVLIALASLSVFADKATGQDDTGKIVGIWKSLNDVNGEPQTVITINRSGTRLEGKFVFRGLTVNEQENVTLEIPITNIAFDGKTLSFRATFPEPGKEVTDWELKLRNDNEAGFNLVRENGKPVEDAPSFVMKKEKAN